MPKNDVKNIIICIAGKNEIAVSALLHLINLGYNDRVVVCPNKADTGKSGWQPSLLRFANVYSIPVLNINDVKSLKNLVFISLEYDRIINPSEFSSTRLYNIHFSLLPAFKGMYTSAVPILWGSKQSGVTLHEIDHGIDTGSIIAQKAFDLPFDCTARDLYYLYLKHAFDLFKEQLANLIGSDVPKCVQQSSVGSSYISSKHINYSDLKLDLRQTAESVVKQLRAFSFREYQIPRVCNTPIGSWEITVKRSSSTPGNLSQINESNFRLSTIDYDILLWKSRDFEWFDWLRSGRFGQYMPLDSRYINVKDKNGWTPLICASFWGDYERCRILLENGADPNLTNCNGTTPLMYASSSPSEGNIRKTIDILMSYGANMEIKDRFGMKLADYRQIK